MVSQFGMMDAKHVLTQIAAHFKLMAVKKSKVEREASFMKHVPYMSCIGSIMYAMVSSRPDIAYGIGLISRFMSNPGRSHWQAAKWLLRYLKGTLGEKLIYSRNGQQGCKLVGYCDSDYAGDLDKRRSLSGYVFTVGGNTVSWKSSLQHVVALSTTEAEYIAITDAVKEAMWLGGFLEELGFEQGKLVVNCDSQSAIHLTKNTMYHERTKHIDIRLHFIRDVIAEGRPEVVKIPTEVNPPDVLTKVVPVDKFKQALSLLNLKST